MTTPEMAFPAGPQGIPSPTADPTASVPAPDIPPAVAPDAPFVEAPTGTEPPARRDRRKKALLLLLASLVALLVFIAGWFLITRKPISEFPLPAIVESQMPNFSFAIYGVGKPIGVAVSPDGSRIYATQSEGDELVVIFDGKGAKVGTIKPPATGTDHAFTYVAVDPSTGDVYVSDRRAGAIYVYSADGLYRRTIVPGGMVAPAFQPLGLTLDAQGNLYVADAGGPFASVRVFDRTGTLVRTLGETGSFSFPNGVALDGKGNVYVADSNHGRLAILDQTGRVLASVNRGSAAGELGLPRGLAIDDAGRVFVVDTTAQQVQVYRTLVAGDRSPKYVAGFGAEGSVDGTFEFPNGVAVDGRARVYVADWANDRIQVWSY